MASRPSTGNIPSSPAQQSMQDNLAARALILQTGVDRIQSIYANAINPANQTVVNIPPQNVGLIRGFLIKVEGVISNTNVGTSGVALTRSSFGTANLLSAIQFTDLNNQVRHNTTGWHMNLINSVKSPCVFGGAYTPNVPVGYGSNYDVMTGASTIAANTTTAVQMYYYIPLAYTKTDLRGAMWAGVVNAVAQLQLTINPTPVIASGDPQSAVYTGNTGGWSGNVTLTVWQDYIDQIPRMQDGTPLLPARDMQTLYQLENTALTGLVANQQFGIPYANFREFYSTIVRYDNNGVFNAGTDITSFALQTANSSNIWQYGPEEAALLARGAFLADPPVGTYYFDSRVKPINSQQFGNTQLTVVPSAVTAGASMLVGWEYMAQASQVVYASSLPTTGN